jgi:hypothetical protein
MATTESPRSESPQAGGLLPWSCPEGLRPLLGAIDAILSQRAPALSPVLLFEDLRDEVHRHFDAEEQGGYFADVRASAPWLSGRLDELLEEHREFRIWTEELVELARCCRTDPDAVDVLVVAYGELRDSLWAHERKEDELTQEAFQVDLGGC